MDQLFIVPPDQTLNYLVATVFVHHLHCNCSCLHSSLQPSVDVPLQSPRHSYGIRCHLIFSHLNPYLFSVNA